MSLPTKDELTKRVKEYKQKNLEEVRRHLYKTIGDTLITRASMGKSSTSFLIYKGISTPPFRLADHDSDYDILVSADLISRDNYLLLETLVQDLSARYDSVYHKLVTVTKPHKHGAVLGTLLPEKAVFLSVSNDI